MSTLHHRPTPKIPLTTAAGRKTARKVVYPDSDGKPMADNAKQADAIVWLKTNLEDLFADDPDVFVAADLLWYPIQGDNKTRMAPDALVAFGARKGYRGSYKQWEEGFAPQVVFEIWSPGNRQGAMTRKFRFYETYGAEEYYLYNPDTFRLTGWRLDGLRGGLALIDPIDGFISPRLGVRFEAPGKQEMAIYRPDGSRFKTPQEVREELERTAAERDKANAERDKANAKNALFAAKLRELGIDPATL